MSVKPVLVVMLWCAMASADTCPTPSQIARSRSPEEAASAKSLFNKGLRLQSAGKIEEACKLFESSLHLDGQIGTLLNVAECRELKGQLIEAHLMFSEASEAAGMPAPL